MSKIDFGNGRFFDYGEEINDLQTEEGVKDYLLEMYPYIETKNYRQRFEELGLKRFVNDMDEENLIECLFKDVEAYGEQKILDAIVHFETVMAYAREGLACPGGPIPWD